jgi:hypothetical protein
LDFFQICKNGLGWVRPVWVESVMDRKSIPT